MGNEGSTFGAGLILGIIIAAAVAGFTTTANSTIIEAGCAKYNSVNGDFEIVQRGEVK